MKEEEIRPDNLMAENGKLHAKDAAEILIRRKEFKKINCPACESEKQKFAFKKDGFNFVICLKCGTLFVNPRPPRELLINFYKNSRSIRHWSDKIFPASCGFEVVEILTPGKLDAELVRKKILRDDSGIFLNRPFIRHILVDKWKSLGNSFQRFLADNNLSSHLWVVAKKK